jgi:hypothetical protein
MNNITLEIIEKNPVKEKKVTIREEKNTIKIIPQEGKGNPLPPKQPSKPSNIQPNQPSLSTIRSLPVLQQRKVITQRPVIYQISQPRRMPFMMNFNRNIGRMPMHFK